jgi:hypothetical protein
MVLDARWSGGQAVIVPCKTEVREIEGLAEEVRWLWAAEENSTAIGRFHKSWGCVGALFSPKAVTCGLQDQWRDHFQAAKPSSPLAVDSEGKLNIPWPSTVEGAPIAGFDVILATATMPNPEDGRPNAAEIAQAWIRQNSGHERYFFENVRHDIRTRDDPDIWRTIAEQKPRWIERGEYADVIKELQSEAKSQRSQ